MSSTPTNVDVQSISSLEDYLVHMGMFALSVRSLDELQKRAISIGILDEDEMECAKTIRFEIQRLLTTMNDQFASVMDHTGESWDSLKERLIHNVPKPKKKK